MAKTKLALDMKTVADAGSGKRMVARLHPGIIALRSVLKRMRWDDQGGYSSYEGDGKWSFVSTALPQTSPTELNALFDLAGLVPDVIKSKGSCEDCAHAEPCNRDGFITYHDRGYSKPCCGCKHPQMSNFKSRKVWPVMRRFWCFQCGALFKKREDRDLHREQRVRGKCALTGQPE
jgi:hypothetical protein